MIAQAKVHYGTLLTLSKNGGYVCSEYRGIKSPIIGYVAPNTPVELMEGVWGSKNTRKGGKAILKALRLAEFRTLDPADYVSLSVARPRQGTLVRWRSVRKRIENLVLNKKVILTLNDLSADQQETMCAEFLRMQQTSYLPKLETLLLPVGRTMKDVDIVGVSSSGKKMYAQVTYGKLEEYRYKIDRLKKFKDSNVDLILFCRCDSPTVDNGITIFPIQKAFEQFTALEQGQRWLQAAS